VADGAVVLDASAMVDLLIGQPLGQAVANRIDGVTIHAPAHFDAEILSALGRLNRAGAVSAHRVGVYLALLADAPVRRHPFAPLLGGAWRRRARLRLVDALYVELARRLGLRVLTTDAALGRASSAADVVGL